MTTHTVKLTKLVTILAFCSACVSHQEGEITDCSSNPPEIALSSKSDPNTCESNNGQIVVAGSAGQEPYQYKLNTNEYQASGTFEGLGGGTYTLTVKDAKGCETSTEATLKIVASDLVATHETTADTGCTSDNGSITVAASGTNTPFQYQLGAGTFGTASTFNNLKNGSYTVTVKDAMNCTITVNATVARGESGISYKSNIEPIILANCAVSGCHVTGGRRPDLSSYTAVKAAAAGVKNRTGNRTMPIGANRTLSQEQIDMIACWVDDGAKDN